EAHHLEPSRPRVVEHVELRRERRRSLRRALHRGAHELPPFVVRAEIDDDGRRAERAREQLREAIGRFADRRGLPDLGEIRDELVAQQPDFQTFRHPPITPSGRLVPASGWRGRAGHTRRRVYPIRARRASASATLTPSTRTRLLRLVAPETIRTERTPTSKKSERVRTSASFATPSTGAPATATSITSPRTPRTRLFPALGLTRTASVTPLSSPLTARDDMPRSARVPGPEHAPSSR